MGVFGVDVSNHNKTFDFRGWDFAFIKASQGNWFEDLLFQQHLRNARAAGCLVAAYHYQETSSAESQVAFIKKLVPVDIPIIIDVERGGGGVDITRRLIDLLRNEGYTVPFLYLPRWYWNEIGQPDLRGLPRLWGSWYPDYVARPKEVALGMVPQSAWSDYGGNNVAMIQFTSTPFDQDYYPGSRDELARLLYGGTGGGGIDEMLDRERDYPELLAMLFRAFFYDLRPQGVGADWKLGPTIFEMFNTLLSRSVADVDEAVLAEELAKRGIGSVDVAKVKEALSEVLSGTKLTPGS
jgi:hypothetical protein